MNPQQRARRLSELHVDRGWVLEFTTAGQSQNVGTVHVIGPPEDQPPYADAADGLMFRRWRAVCGRVVRRTPLDATAGEFADHRLCRSCHTAFEGETAMVIFESNTDHAQQHSGSTNQAIRLDLELEAEEAARELSKAGGRQ